MLFASTSGNLVPGDTNATTDVFLRDRASNRAPDARLDVRAAGSRVTADATASSDHDSPGLDGRISFGDGTPEVAGLKAVHDYTRGGTFTVTATVVDSDGATVTTSRAVTVTVAAPAAPVAALAAKPAGAITSAAARQLLLLDKVKLSKKSISAARRTKTALKFRVSDAATVTVRIVRLPNSRLRLPASVSKRVTAGSRSVTLSAKVGTKRLTPGTYRLEVSARTADGRKAKARNLALTVTR